MPNVAILDLDFDAILAAMHAFTDSAEGDCYLSVPPNPGSEAAALGASATTLTPLSRPVAVSLADPSGGLVLAHSSTVLQCPPAPLRLLSGLHLPSFSINLVSGADLQDAWVDQFAPGGQRVTHCTCSRTGRHLATFTRRPGSSLYTQTTASPPVSASAQVATSSQVLAAASRSSPASAPCLCHPLLHETLLWHHRLGHPSLPRLREAPLQTLHMDVWGPARVCGQGHERYFLLVVDDYSRYITVFPLRSKGEVTEVLIDWIRGARRQLSESFGSDLPVLRLHSDRGGEFSFDLLRAFCRAEGIRQTFTLPASPQQNGIAERRIGMYAAHQINLQPRVSLPETTPTLRWTGKVGDASAFRVWGSRAFVRDTSADKLSSCAVPCVFLGFPPDAPGWQFYHPTLRCILSSRDVTFDESVSYYRLFPYRTASLPPPPLFLAPGTPLVDPLPPQGPALLGVSQVDPAEPVEVAVGSGATGGAKPAGAGTGGAEPWGVERERRLELGGAEPGGTAFEGAEPMRAESGGSPGVPLRQEPLSPQRLREWYARRCRRATGAAGGAASAGATGGAAGAGATGGSAGAGAAGTGAGGAAGVVTGDPGAEGTSSVSAVSEGASRPRLYFVPLLQQVLGQPPSLGPTPPLLSPPPVQSQSPLQPSSPLPGPSPYSGLTRGLTERREPESRHVLPVSRSLGCCEDLLRYLCSTSGMGLVLGGRARVVLTGHADASWVDDLATQRSSQGYTFRLGSGSVSWRSTRSSSVLSSSCEAEIYAGAISAQELRWLTYLLTDLGEAPRSPLVLYVDNKAMLALCQEQKLEHRTKHIALRYFLARELQQRGQLRLVYVASQAKSADVFTKALQPCDHQRFYTVLACFAFLDWSCDLLFSPTLPMGV
ncbi:unnamed protein product [Closterium sp. NIES-53]